MIHYVALKMLFIKFDFPEFNLQMVHLIGLQNRFCERKIQTVPGFFIQRRQGKVISVLDQISDNFQIRRFDIQ